MDFKNIAIVYVRGSAHRIHFWYMSKHKAISSMTKSNLIDKKVFYQWNLAKDCDD